MASLKARIQAHLLAAQAYANLSSATRLKVGALLIKEDRIISVGYNGMPKGMTNICEYEENLNENSNKFFHNGRAITSC